MRRPALSLVELLVAVGIVALLVGLLIPAVQKARDAAVRVSSQNNLRQLAVAAHDYESANRQLPGTGKTTFDGTPVLFFDLLPHVGAGGVYAEFTLNGRVIVPPPQGGPAHVVKTYVSPKDVSLPGGATADGRACASYTHNPGVFQDNATLARVADGTAFTTMFSDRQMRCRDVDNPWFAAQPDFLMFGAFPPESNFAPTPDGCDPERVCTPHRPYILVAMADGSTHTVSYLAASLHWVTAAIPDDGVTPGPEW